LQRFENDFYCVEEKIFVAGEKNRKKAVATGQPLKIDDSKAQP
jgi:hypothetical protein